jgi:hypothetical protein
MGQPEAIALMGYRSHLMLPVGVAIAGKPGARVALSLGCPKFPQILVKAEESAPLSRPWRNCFTRVAVRCQPVVPGQRVW